MSEDHAPSELHVLLVAEYPRYVARVLEERGIGMDEVLADAIVEGTSVLDGLLTTLDRTPALEQRTSPLELFREALRPVDHALSVIGVPQGSAGGRPASLAWDRYDLAPGSSQVLGSDVHEAHMRWAITKAQAIAPMVSRPTAQVVAAPADRDRVAAAVEALGYTVEPEGSVLVIDADLPSANDTIAAAVAGDSPARRVVAYGRSVDDLRDMALRALGAHVVVDAQRFFDTPEEYLPRLV